MRPNCKHRGSSTRASLGACARLNEIRRDQVEIVRTTSVSLRPLLTRAPEGEEGEQIVEVHDTVRGIAEITRAWRGQGPHCEKSAGVAVRGLR